MALSTQRGKISKRGDYGAKILDQDMMQTMQDVLCAANQIYCICLSEEYGTITDAYGSGEELAYLMQEVTVDRYQLLMQKLSKGSIENVVEEEQKAPYIKMCAVAIRLNERAEAVWMVAGFLKDRMGPDCHVPSYIMTTTEELFYKSLKLLETLSKQLFSVKLDEVLAQKAFLKSKQSEERMEAELRRSEVMTEIVRMLESDNRFTVIVDNILKEVCGHLHLSNAALFQIKKDQTGVEIISEYAEKQGFTFKEAIQNTKAADWPFFTGKPYMISSDSILPEHFEQLFQKFGIKAAVYLPIEANGQAMMYAAFHEMHQSRVFSIPEIKFLNDVRRIVQSILARRITRNSLASSYASLDAILENVGCGIYVCDEKEERLLYTNQCYRDFFREENQRRNIESLLGTQNPDHEPRFREYYAEDENRWFDVYNSRIHWVDGREVMLYTIYEVTDKKLYQQKIERQANNDFLTGLYNRMRCEQDLKENIRQAKEMGGRGALLYIDLDDFKHINDGLGHQYGDVLLKSISSKLQQITGIESTCYRMGGDEFIIIVPHHYYNLLNNILDEIHGIFTKPWLLKGADYYCTMSMGVVRFPMDGDDVDELIRKADIALYEAKKTGKNRMEYYDEGVESTSFKRLDLEKNMRNATTNSCREFEVYYQPIMGSDHICQGAEALVRWNSKEMGFISPAEFIPLAEYLGLINPIGNYVLEEACMHCKYWNDTGHPDYQVNVNLSVVQLLKNDIVDRIQDIIVKTGIYPGNLVLEVTESLAVNDIARMKIILGDIKQLGVKVAMDDFGTGYSSLNHIREMPLDIIKIDRCFIMDIGKDEFSEAFVKMVAELAATIGVTICVEGVEEQEQYEIISGMKIEQFQGYFYDKPMTLMEFEEKYL